MAARPAPASTLCAAVPFFPPAVSPRKNFASHNESLTSHLLSIETIDNIVNQPSRRSKMKMRLLTLLSTIALSALAVSAEAATLKVGVVPGVYADSIEALVPEAKAKGLDIEVVEFTDWTT